MNKLVYLLFLSVFFLDFFHFDLEIIPRFATWLPEIIVMFTCLVFALRFAFKKRIAIHLKYITLIILYSTIILIGIIFNTSPPESIFVGIRTHFKHLPFFLLPAVYDFSEEQFKKQLQFILPLLILQCPLVVYQRFFQFEGVTTGDVITGTLSGSGTLSITMICSIAVIFALYLKEKIGIKFFLAIALCLFLPTTINETKVTLFLLPLALVLPVFFLQGEGSSKAKSLLVTALIGLLFISVFIPIYDHFAKPRVGFGILGFFENKNRITEYLYRDVGESDCEQFRRGDTIVLTYKNLSKDLSILAFGRGMGSLIGSYFESMRKDSGKGSQHDGFKYGSDTLTITNLFWELGLLGLIVYVTFFLFLFRDALLLRKSANIFGSFALGWSSVIVVIGICLAYMNIIHENVVNLMFWYFSGVIAANTFRMRALQGCLSKRTGANGS